MRFIGLTTFLITEFTPVNQKYIFFEAGKECLLLNLVFSLITLSKINTLCLGDETKSGEKQRQMQAARVRTKC